MKELINIRHEQAVTTSVIVADVFGKRHDKVIRTIKKLAGGLAKNGETYFKKSLYIEEQNNQKYPMYYMNRDGFMLLVMGFTGRKALEWKIKFIDAFNQMEAELNMRKADKQIQKNSMQYLHDNLKEPESKDYMKVNQITNKCVSKMYGCPKTINKADMTQEMLISRESVLKDTVELMVIKDKYGLNVPVSESIYKKYNKTDVPKVSDNELKELADNG